MTGILKLSVLSVFVIVFRSQVFTVMLMFKNKNVTIRRPGPLANLDVLTQEKSVQRKNNPHNLKIQGCRMAVLPLFLPQTVKAPARKRKQLLSQKPGSSSLAEHSSCMTKPPLSALPHGRYFSPELCLVQHQGNAQHCLLVFQF